MNTFLAKTKNYLLVFKKWGEETALGGFVFSILKSIWIVFVVVVIFVALGKNAPSNTTTENNSNQSNNSNQASCSVVGINLHGDLTTYIPAHAENDSFFNYDQVSSENIVDTIRRANADPAIKAIIVEVDSGGGSPVAGEEVSEAIKNSEKPVVAMIRQMGASASYWAISGAKKIFASKNSDVGSIGVTSSYLSTVEKNKKTGYSYVQLSVGKFKDSGTPDKPLTEEERQLFLRDINIVYNNFIEAIAKNRNLSIPSVRAIADGSTVLGQKAKDLGLIDEIGGFAETDEYVTSLIGEKPVICWK